MKSGTEILPLWEVYFMYRPVSWPTNLDLNSCWIAGLEINGR